MSHQGFSRALRSVLLGGAALTVGMTDVFLAKSAIALEEIRVTARKREESLQEVPVAVTSFSAEQIINTTAQDLSDLQGLVPNFRMDGSGGFNIRGFQDNSGNTMNGDPGVAFYVDGVYRARSTDVDIPTTGIERVEVLRGPQGTLFGRNTVGGAINIVTASPHSEFEATGRVLGGNYDRFNAALDLNVPIAGDKIVARGIFESKNRDGFGNSPITGQGIREEESLNTYGSLLIQPTDRFKVTLRGDWRERNDSGLARNLIGFSTNFANTTQLTSRAVVDLLDGSADFPFTPTPEDFFVTNDSLSFDMPIGTQEWIDLEEWGVSGTAEFEITESVGSKVIVAYRDLYRNDRQDIDGTPATILDAELIIDQNQTTLEGQLFGETPVFGINTSWFVGAFYFEEDGIDISASNALVPLNPLNPRFITADVKSESTAIFGQVGLELTERLTFNAGIRYTEDTKELTSKNSTGAFACDVGFDSGFDQTVPNSLGAPVPVDLFVCPNGSLSATTAFQLAAVPRAPVPSAAFIPVPLIFQQDKSVFESEFGFGNTGGVQSGIWSICTVSSTGAPLDDPAACVATFEDSFDAVSWMLGLDFTIVETDSETVLVYLKRSRGYRAGGQNLRDVFGDNAFEPEYADDWEFGIKADWFNGNLRTNFAAFSVDYTDIQVSNIISTAGGLSQIITNAAEATIQGIELEVGFVPFPQRLSGLQVFSTLGIVDAKFDSFPDQQPLNQFLPVDPVTNPLTDIDRSSEPFVRTPDWNYSIRGLYTHETQVGDLTFQVDYARVGTQHFSNLNTDTDLNSQEPYGLLNGRIQFSPSALTGDVSLALWCRNCTDEVYKAGGLSFDNQLGQVLAFRGDPATYGGEIVVRFGGRS